MEKRKKRLIISIIIFSILLLTTIFLAIKVNNTNNLNYEKVECNVSRMEKYWIKRQQKYKIYCMYNGDEKEIKNVKNDYYNYSKGKNVDAYLYNNKLYANYEGIKQINVIDWLLNN